MKNKFKSFTLALVLGVFGLLAGLGLSGCGASLTTLKNDYAAMEKKIQTNSQAFSYSNDQQGDGISSKFEVLYGTRVDGLIKENDSFKELSDKYNSILELSNDYIANNIQIVINLDQKKLSKSAKKGVERLCKDIKAFTKNVDSFVTAKNGFEDYFDKFEELSKENIESQLVLFKKSYGVFVEKNLAISRSLASCMEKTKIYETLQNSKTDRESLRIVRDYTRAKMLPIFSTFMLSEISNQFTWNNYKARTEYTDQIDKLLQEVERIYKGDFQALATCGTTNTDAKLSDIFDYVNEFIEEADCYIDALKDFNIREFAVANEGNMTNYLKSNKLAERQLYKIDQFLKITLPSFISNFTATIS